jgi:hypothetical protein
MRFLKPSGKELFGVAGMLTRLAVSLLKAWCQDYRMKQGEITVNNLTFS